MNYYNKIKSKFIDNEVYKKVKDYSKNKNELQTYYELGKLLVETQGGEEHAKYGDGLIKEYSAKLTKKIDKKYNDRTLRRMRQFYLVFKDEIWSDYTELLSIKDINEINYYINICIEQNLPYRKLKTMNMKDWMKILN